MSDPRQHRQVVASEGDPIRYRCGCVNAIDQASGVLKSVSKCSRHKAQQQAPTALGRDYYQSHGIIDAEGNLQTTAHVAELFEALSPFPKAPGASGVGVALEVGCGASPYVEALRSAGWLYLGCEPSRWARDWMWDQYQASVMAMPLEEIAEDATCGLILAAHCLEHMEDAPGAIMKCGRLLEPGGELWVIVPNDEDPLNPDHMWYFDETTLRRCLEAAGLEVMKVATRKYIERESFLYAKARKPA